jgi:hypothetical protein
MSQDSFSQDAVSTLGDGFIMGIGILITSYAYLREVADNGRVQIHMGELS